MARPSSSDGSDAPEEVKDPRADEEDSFPGLDSESVELLIGTEILDGEYVLKECIGRGAMGAVFKADHPAMGRTVAIKVLLPQVQTDDDMVARFDREARAASRLSHPNSVHVHLFGKLDDGTLFTIMELLEGEDLGTVLVREAPLDLTRTMRIGLQILSALSEAHSFGIVHRDLKPPNIFLTERGGLRDFVKVLDYGIAKLLQPDDAEELRSLTQAGTVFGTPEYMAPEQARGERVDGRADLYAVATILYVALAARHPFKASTSIEYLAKHATAAPISLRQQAPEIPDEIAQVIMRTLSKRPEKRAPSAAALAADLVAAWRASAIRDPSVAPPQLNGIHLPSEDPAGLADTIPPPAETGDGMSTARLRAYADSQRREGHGRDAETIESALTPRSREVDLEPDDEPPARKPRVVQTLALLLVVVGAGVGIFFAARGPTPGRLIVDTTPSGAVARVDGQAESTTPARFDALHPGQHTLEVTMAGRRAIVETFVLGEGEELLRRYELARARVMLRLHVEAPGGVILARREGRLERLGESPAVYGSVAGGESVSVEIYAPGYAPFRGNVAPPEGLPDGDVHTELIKLGRGGKLPGMKLVLAERDRRAAAFRACLPSGSTVLHVSMALSIEGGAVTHARVFAGAALGGPEAVCMEQAVHKMSWSRIAPGAKGHYLIPVVARK